jgi:hypothetical protein
VAKIALLVLSEKYDGEAIKIGHKQLPALPRGGATIRAS